MTFTYAFRDTAETMAANLASDQHEPFAVFDGISNDVPTTCICPLAEFGEAAERVSGGIARHLGLRS